MKKIINLFIAVIVISALPHTVKAQEYGKYAVGLQRGIWALYGPSASIDINRRIGFQTVVGIIPANKETNANLGIFERILYRPITYKTNSLYLVGMFGASHWHYIGPAGGNIVEAYEWGTNAGIMGGAEFDLRMLMKKFIPIFVNIEGGIEHRQTKYTTSSTYPTYGFGIHYRF